MHAELRARLAQAGLEHHADALVALAVSSIRLRAQDGPASGELGGMRPPGVVDDLTGGIVAVAGGGFHGLALTADGSVLAWGSNECGQLGDGTRRDRDDPVEVADLEGVVAIAAGESHSLALRSDGSVAGWGDNGSGQLGDGTREQRRTPVGVGGLDGGVVAIAAGQKDGLALRADGSVAGWGWSVADGRGEVPDGAVGIPGLGSGIVAVAAGGYHRLVLTEDGAVLGWGFNAFGVLGDGTRTDRRAPGPVTGLSAGVAAIAVGEDHSLALTPDGGVLGWGMGRGGADQLVPARVTDAGVVATAIAAGVQCSFAVLADGSALSWGWNWKGQLGDGTSTDRPRALPIPRLHAVVAIAPRVALTAAGSVLAWGGEQPSADLNADAVALGATRLGGSPDLAAGACWPIFDGRPMAFVAQVNLAEVARLDPSGALPPSGLASFFCAPADLHREGGSHVIFTGAEETLTEVEPPAGLGAHERHRPVELYAQRELSAVPWESEAVERLGLSREQQFAYRDVTQADDEVPAHRMLGHPDIIQNDPRDADPDLCLLLQVDSDEAAGMEWGDAGRLYYWIRPDDLQARRLEQSWLEHQSY